MQRLITKENIILFLFLTVIFSFIFECIQPYYIKPNESGRLPEPIDAVTMKDKEIFNANYVIYAKEKSYKIDNYYQSFFIVDMVFPIIYTLFFLSALTTVNYWKRYNLFKKLILAAMVADYLENISFAVFLKLKGDGLAPVVAFFTTIKSLLIAVNIVVLIIIIITLLRNEKDQGEITPVQSPLIV